jgi:hypothetical protein
MRSQSASITYDSGGIALARWHPSRPRATDELQFAAKTLDKYTANAVAGDE